MQFNLLIVSKKNALIMHNITFSETKQNLSQIPILMPFLSPANEKTRKLQKLLKMTDDLLILFLPIMINGKSF